MECGSSATRTWLLPCRKVLEDDDDIHRLKAFGFGRAHHKLGINAFALCSAYSTVSAVFIFRLLKFIKAFAHCVMPSEEFSRSVHNLCYQFSCHSIRKDEQRSTSTSFLSGFTPKKCPFASTTYTSYSESLDKDLPKQWKHLFEWKIPVGQAF